MMRVSSATERSSRWSTSSRSSRSAPSRRASGRSGSRRAACATASASIRSDFAVGAGAVSDVRHQLRRDPNYPFACGDQSRSRRRLRWRQSSIAHRRSPHCSVAQLNSDRWPSLVLPMVFVDSCRPRPIDNDGGVGALVRIDPDDPRGDMSPAEVAGGWHGPVGISQ